MILHDRTEEWVAWKVILPTKEHSPVVSLVDRIFLFDNQQYFTYDYTKDLELLPQSIAVIKYGGIYRRSVFP